MESHDVHRADALDTVNQPEVKNCLITSEIWFQSRFTLAKIVVCTKRNLITSKTTP